MKFKNLLCCFTIISTLNTEFVASKVENLVDVFICKIKAEILELQPRCTNVVTTTESSFDYSGKAGTLMTHFYVNFSTNLTIGLPFWSPAAILHYKPCSLLLFNISFFLRQSNNFSMDYNNWPTVPYAGSFLSSCYLFFMDFDETSEISNSHDLLLGFANTTRKLPNAFFVSIRPDGQLDVFARTAFADRLMLISTYSNPGSVRQDERHILEYRPNFQGLPMIATVCPICDKSLERFERTGQWNDYATETMYELARYANATLEPVAVFGAPRTGLTPDGDWDDFALPLIDGSGVVTQLLEPTDYNRRYLLSSSPIYFDNVAFITAHPKRLRFASLARLAAPLRLNIWVGMGLSFVFLFIALEMVIQAYRKLEFKRRARCVRKASFVLTAIEKSLIWEAVPDHHWHWTAFALVSSALDQVSILSGAFARNVDGNASRLLFSLWYLILIVIGCAYKSILTSTIVKPVYVHPPATFAELVESDYKIGAIFYTGNLDANFAALNNSVSRAIQERVHEDNFLEPDVSQDLA